MGGLLTRPSRVLSAEERMNSTDPFDIVDMCYLWDVVDAECECLSDSIYMNSTKYSLTKAVRMGSLLADQ